ncbi:MAG: hypothetical protein ACE5GJ_06395 [Gemmatimonadota bacterium]
MRPRKWIDADGIEWTIQWVERTLAARTVGGGDHVLPAGLRFTCAALTFHVPSNYPVDPRALPDARLQRMVDLALE